MYRGMTDVCQKPKEDPFTSTLYRTNLNHPIPNLYVFEKSAVINVNEALNYFLFTSESNLCQKPCNSYQAFKQTFTNKH